MRRLVRPVFAAAQVVSPSALFRMPAVRLPAKMLSASSGSIAIATTASDS